MGEPALSLALASTAAHADDKVKQAARARPLEGVEQVKRSEWEGGYLLSNQAYSAWNSLLRALDTYVYNDSLAARRC